jgi:hypothetical protein
MDEPARKRLRFQCPHCGAHTMMREPPIVTLRCPVCGSTDLTPILEIPPSIRALRPREPTEDSEDGSGNV